jgi:predicted AAA+ superfamily ATPase
MYPLTAVELGKDFDLATSLKFGFLPSVFLEHDPKAYLESYVKTYLDEEIRHEGLARNLGAFARFLESASFSQGSVLSVSAIARDCAVERKVVENYFSILVDLLIAYKLPVFTKKAKRRMVSHPKFYFFDVGVYRTLRPMGPLDRPEEVEGIALETMLYQQLVAVNESLRLGYSIYYWRTANNMEVDFVLYGEKGILAFEIKRTGKVSGSMLSGLKSFLKDYPMAKAYFVYGGEKYMREGDIEIIPINHLIKNLASFLDKPLTQP